MKLTIGKWGGKNKPGRDITLEIKGEENFMHKCGVRSGRHYQEQPSRNEGKIISNFQERFQYPGGVEKHVPGS